jgi:Cof subfamily protein (haloacid dehalogenase superfamily)
MIRSGLPKLIATDLDGTLVRGDETVSEYTHQVLARTRAAGIQIAGATGRGPRLLELVRHDIPSAGFLVMGGGAQVLDLTNPAHPVRLRDERLAGAVLGDILSTIEDEIGQLSVLVEGAEYHNAPLWGDPDPSWRYNDLVAEMTRSDALAGPVIKGFARHPEHDADTLLALAQRLIPTNLASITQAGLGYIEICAPGIDKASGLALVAAVLGIDRAEVLAFGDMPNDISMLRWAGFGSVAVGNAHPAVLGLATEVTGSNDADGVADYLDRLLRL